MSTAVARLVSEMHALLACRGGAENGRTRVGQCVWDGQAGVRLDLAPGRGGPPLTLVIPHGADDAAPLRARLAPSRLRTGVPVLRVGAEESPERDVDLPLAAVHAPEGAPPSEIDRLTPFGAGNALQVLAAVIELLPDDTVLSELSIADGGLMLRGQTGTAAPLIAALAADPPFRDPGLAAPVRRAEGGSGESFALRADLGR